jgi:hypothetical protein
LPLFSYLAADEVRQIIRMPSETGADLISARSYAVFIENVRKSSILGKEELNDMLANHHAGYLVVV